MSALGPLVVAPAPEQWFTWKGWMIPETVFSSLNSLNNKITTFLSIIVLVWNPSVGAKIMAMKVTCYPLGYITFVQFLCVRFRVSHFADCMHVCVAYRWSQPGSTSLCYVTGRLGDGVTDTLKAKSNKHSTSRALRKKQRERLRVCMRESVSWLNTHSSPLRHRGTIGRDLDASGWDHWHTRQCWVRVISYTYTQSHTHAHKHTYTPEYC